MTTPFKNIIILGATGSVGAPILAALLAEPTFTTTILTRATSRAKLPPNVPVISISDAYTRDELTRTFTGQDVVISALNTTAVTQDDLAFRIVDAALAAGVRRIIPSEFGANNLDPRATELVPVYALKGNMLRYLMQKAEASHGALTWTSIACGSWLDWALDPGKSGNFLGIDVRGRRATIWDSGRARFSVTTAGNTGLAVARVLQRAEMTANKQVFLSDFVTSLREVVDALERLGGQGFVVEEKESGPAIREARERFEKGEFEATYPLLAISFAGDVDVGYDFEKEQTVWNEALGLPTRTLDEVVMGAIESANSS
ncbi:isoflavone reductase family protein (NmrA-like family protein) [Paraphaeosphaeria sporulosa]